MSKQLLRGIRVADFTWAWAGPLSTKILSDYGAEVIKIEGIARPDPERVVGATRGQRTLNNTANYMPYNTGKLSVTVNLTKPAGKEIAKRIVAASDIVTENFSGGTMERMGLGYHTLRALKPDIIMLSSSMHGQTGPCASLGGAGVDLTALSGLNEITGWPDRPPVYLGYHTDFIAPRFNILAIVCALDYRRRTGKGLYLDASQLEGTLQFMAPVLVDFAATGRVAFREGNRVPDAAPHGTYHCLGEDRWCAIAVDGDDRWLRFGRAVGNPPWTADSRFATIEGRKEYEEELDALVESWTSQRTAEEVMETLQAAGIAAGVVQNARDLTEGDPQLAFRAFYRVPHHPEAGDYRAPRPAVTMSKVDCDVRPSPLIGQHNLYVYKEILGLTEDEMAELAATGVIE